MGKKADLTKQQIRSAAFALFAEYGYTKVTMQDICEKSQLSKGGLYRHYADKRQLFTEILQIMQKEETFREQNGMELGLPAAEILNGFLEHIRQDLSKSSPQINIALYEFCLEYKEDVGSCLLSTQFQKGRSALTSLIEYGTTRGEFDSKDPQAAASAILFLVEGLRMTNEVMPVSDEILSEVFNQIKQLMGVNYEN